MLDTLRNWGRNQLAILRDVTVRKPSPEKAGVGREHRAELVARHRADIHRIQHEISVLNDAISADPAGGTAAQAAKMAELHSQLARAQHELGKYQARI